MEFEEALQSLTATVDGELDRRLPSAAEQPRALHEAMRYSVFAGGKRLRPAICLLVARAVAIGRGIEPACGEEAALAAACALEMVHTYSLIHDDLPCMDDDDMRRGKPSCHKAFGEATAVLAGDALNTLAFGTAADSPTPHAAAAVALLAECSGPQGIVGGQVDDLAAMGQAGDAALLESIHLRKTARLFMAATGMGAIAAGGDRECAGAWQEIGKEVGLAFQIIDDILDVTASSTEMGKTTGKDARDGKLTYPAVHGLESSRRLAGERLDRAAELLQQQGDPEGVLTAMLSYLRQRRS